MTLTTSLMARGGSKKPHKADVTDNLCFKLTTLLVYGAAQFIMRADDSLLVIHLPSLRKHIGGRVTIADLKAASHKLVHWGVILTYKEAFDVMVLKLHQPTVFRESVVQGRTRCSLPALLELGVGKRQAKLAESAISRMTKEMK
jgi:hypothetical protein